MILFVLIVIIVDLNGIFSTTMLLDKEYILVYQPLNRRNIKLNVKSAIVADKFIFVFPSIFMYV